jgi:hypothetical protein
MSDVVKGGAGENQFALSGLLPPEIDGLRGLIKQHLEKRGAAIGLPYLANEATSALGKELDKINLVEQLAKGWSTLKTVRKAAHAPPGETTLLSLGEHHLTLKASPTLKLTIGGVHAPDLTLSLDVAAKFDSATLSVRDGALVGADPGDCEMSAKLSSGSADIGPPWDFGKVDLKGPLTFSPPCPIPV